MKNLDDYYKAHASEIYKYIYALSGRPEIADDVLQEAFYRAYTHLESFTGQNLRAWLYRIAHNVYIDYYRKEKRSQPQDTEFFVNIPGASDVEKDMIKQEHLAAVFRQIENLPPQQKQALLLHSIHQLSYAEIATVLEVSESSVKSLIFRARAKLKQKVKGVM